ncbi:MAG: SMP-30/gluconolactonase/LRE family protein, partial [Candidatus Eiseniibacteriota bacterium]
TNNRSAYPNSFCLTSSILLVVLGVVLLSGIGLNLYNVNRAHAQQPSLDLIKVNKLWETANDLKNPESVAFSPKQDVFFVSNINGNPTQKDQNGFISKVSPTNGSIIELRWVSGLNAPKGIAISNSGNRLYVSDINDLVEIDIDSGKILKTYNAPASAFLNDVASDDQGNIYVSDTITNTIYKLNATDTSVNGSPSLQAWLQSPQLNGPNGLHVDNTKGKLIVASLGKMSKPGAGIEVVDLKSKTVTELGKEGTTSPFGGLDGIESDAAEKLYYVTDNPAGKLFVVNADGTGYRVLMDLHTHGAADLGLLPARGTIIIPIMQDNKLIAFKLTE